MMKFLTNFLSSNGPDTVAIGNKTVTLTPGPDRSFGSVPKSAASGPAPEVAVVAGRAVALNDGPIDDEPHGFDVASRVQAQAEAPKAKAPEPSKAALAEMAATPQAKPGPQIRIEGARHETSIDRVLAKARVILADDLKKLAANAAELKAMRADLHQRGLSSVNQAKLRIQEIERAIPDCASADEIEKAAYQISVLKGITPHLCKEASRAALMKLNGVNTEAHGILDRLDVLLAGYANEAEALESEFFAHHGHPREVTALSKAVIAAQQYSKGMREQLAPLPGSESETHWQARMASDGFVYIHDPAAILGRLIG